MDRTLTVMAFLGQSHLYDGILWNSHLSMAFLRIWRLSITFIGFSQEIISYSILVLCTIESNGICNIHILEVKNHTCIVHVNILM